MGDSSGFLPNSRRCKALYVCHDVCYVSDGAFLYTQYSKTKTKKWHHSTGQGWEALGENVGEFTVLTPTTIAVLVMLTAL